MPTSTVERALQSEPNSLRLWLQLIEESQGDREVNVSYERGLQQLPSSFKLWSDYLRVRVHQIHGVHLAHPAIRAVDQVFRRAVTALPMMPRLWLLYGDFCRNNFQSPERAFLVLKEALRALPLSQHTKMWNEGIRSLARDDRCPPPVSHRLTTEFLKLKEDFGSHFSYLSTLATNKRLSPRLGLGFLTSLLQRFPQEAENPDLWDVAISMADSYLQGDETEELVCVPLLLEVGIASCPSKREQLLRTSAFSNVRIGNFVAARRAFQQLLESAEGRRDYQDTAVLLHQLEYRLLVRAMQDKRLAEASDEGDAPPGSTITPFIQRCEEALSSYDRELCEAALRLDPSDIHTWLSLMELHSTEQALAASFRRALAGAGTSWLLCAGYLRELHRLGQQETVHSVMESLLLSQGAADSNFLRYVVAGLLSEGKERVAVQLLEKLLKTTEQRGGLGFAHPSNTLMPTDSACVEFSLETRLEHDCVEPKPDPLHLLQEATHLGRLSPASCIRILRRYSTKFDPQMTVRWLSDLCRTNATNSTTVTLLWIEVCHWVRTDDIMPSFAAERQRELLSETFSRVKAAQLTPRQVLAVYFAFAECEFMLGNSTGSVSLQLESCDVLLSLAKEIVSKRQAFASRRNYRTLCAAVENIPLLTVLNLAKGVSGSASVATAATRYFNVLTGLIHITCSTPVEEAVKEGIHEIVRHMQALLWDIAKVLIEAHLALNEADLARRVYRGTVAYLMANGQKVSDEVRSFWGSWKVFEAKHGNQDTFEEMLREKQAVAAVLEESMADGALEDQQE